MHMHSCNESWQKHIQVEMLAGKKEKKMLPRDQNIYALQHFAALQQDIVD